MNEEIKEKYLEVKKANKSDVITRAFTKFAKYEAKNKKDLCFFTIKEILDTYIALEINSFDLLSNMNSQLNAYTEWCLSYGKHHYPALKGLKINNYSSIHTNELHSLLGTKEADKIITRQELLDMARKLPNPSDAFILLCIFEGLRGRDYSEIREVRWEDFKGDKLHIVPGRIPQLYENVNVPSERFITVSKELIDYANKCRNRTDYRPLINLDKRTELIDEGFIVMRTKKARDWNTQPKLTRRIVEALSYVGSNLSASEIRNSGKVHYINEVCKKKGIKGKDFVFGPYYNDLCTRFNDNIQRQTFWNKFKSKLEEESV